jgi:hypothetical protein
MPPQHSSTCTCWNTLYTYKLEVQSTLKWLTPDTITWCHYDCPALDLDLDPSGLGSVSISISSAPASAHWTHCHCHIRLGHTAMPPQHSSRWWVLKHFLYTYDGNNSPLWSGLQLSPYHFLFSPALVGPGSVTGQKCPYANDLWPQQQKKVLKHFIYTWNWSGMRINWMGCLNHY